MTRSTATILSLVALLVLAGWLAIDASGAVRVGQVVAGR